jgi:hypothetical protein
MRRAPAASRKVLARQAGKRGAASSLAAARDALLSPHPSRFDRLEFGRLSSRKSDEASVHLRQTVEKDRDIDIFVVARLERPEPAVEEGILDSVDQMRENSIQSKRQPFADFIAGHEFKRQNLSDYIDFSLYEMLVDKAVSQARNGLRIDADDLLTDIPVTHVIPHSQERHYCRKMGFSLLP